MAAVDVVAAPPEPVDRAKGSAQLFWERFRGIGPDTTSWGGLLFGAQQYYNTAWWLIVFPGLFLLITTLAFNLLGDGLRDALDVRADR